MRRRWLVIYNSSSDETKATMIDDSVEDDSVTMPFGVEPNQVADDCDIILAIILCADPPTVPFVVIDDEEYSLDPSDPAVSTEDVPDGV